MPYFDLAEIKKNIDILSTDASLDPDLTKFGAQADAWFDEGIEPYVAAVPLVIVPVIAKQATSTYATGLFYIKRDIEKARTYLATAEKQRQDYITKLKLTGQATKTAGQFQKTQGAQ